MNNKTISVVFADSSHAHYAPRICELIYASELICAVPDDQTLIRGIINEFNAIIDEFNASANMSKGQKGEDKEEESEGDDPQYKPITPQN